MLTHHRAATVREILESEFFPGHGKVRKFCGWAGKFGKSGSIREFENEYT